jgi:AmmeMemoRadiSam system protein B
MSERIKALDMKGIECISTGNPQMFKEYLQQTQNTICGRNPILLGLQIIEQAKLKGEWKLQHYSQSSHIQAHDPNQYSVSYVSAIFCVP